MSQAPTAGRTAELAAIRAAYDRSLDHGPVTVLVSGEAGIGKSRLVAAAVAELPGDPMVHSGYCLELGTGSAPYTPFVGIVHELEGTVPRMSGLLTGTPAGEPPLGRAALLGGPVLSS